MGRCCACWRRAGSVFSHPFLDRELAEVVERVAASEPRWKNPNWANWLLWLKTASKMTDEIPVRKTSRGRWGRSGDHVRRCLPRRLAV